MRTTPSPKPIAAALGPHRAVRGGRRVGDQRLGIAEIVRDVHDLQLVEHLERTLLGAARELERHHRAAAGHLPFGQVVLRM